MVNLTAMLSNPRFFLFNRGKITTLSMRFSINQGHAGYVTKGYVVNFK